MGEAIEIVSTESWGGSENDVKLYKGTQRCQLSKLNGNGYAMSALNY